MPNQIILTLLSLIIAGLILWLVRRDHLHSRHAAWWVMTATFIMLLGFFPSIMDYAAAWLGIHYPPSLLFAIGIGLLLLKVLTIDLHQSHIERRYRRLIQKMALLEAELQALQKKQQDDD